MEYRGTKYMPFGYYYCYCSYFVKGYNMKRLINRAMEYQCTKVWGSLIIVVILL